MGRFLSFIGALTFVAFLAAPASAEGEHEEFHGHPRPVSRSAPEIDPTVLGSAAALLVGGGLLLGARRARANR